MNYNKVGNEIIKFVGGEENVKNISHCYSRLRLNLNDESKVNVKKLEETEGVMKVVRSAGQFQIVLGNNVTRVFNAIIENTSLENEDLSVDNNQVNKNIFEKVIDTVAGIFTPCIGIMAACGMIAGILSLLLQIGWLTETSGTYQVYNALANTATYFLPIVLAISACKKFGTNIMTSVVIAAALIHPTMIEFLSSEGSINFMGIPMVGIAYASSVFPIIISIWVLKYLENFLNKFIPEMVKIIFIPLLSLALMVPFTLLVFGPVGDWLSAILADIYSSVIGISPILAGGFLGGLWGIFVMFGIHRTLIPIGISDMMASGSTSLFAFTGMTAFSQAGAALGVAIKTKSSEMKTAAISGSITGLLGISEPAIYGVNMKFKKPMIYGIIGGAIGGMIAGYGGAQAYAGGMASLITLPIFYGEGFIYFLIGIAAAFFSSCLLTIVLGFNDDNIKESQKNDLNSSKTIASPLNGTLIKLEETNDETFSSKILGDGVAIMPTDGKVVAPFNGEVITVFPTKHAIGLLSESGIELLIHIGIDTVELNGELFTTNLKEGQSIKTGDILCTFDLEKIKERGYDTVVPLIITNSNQFSRIKYDNKEVISGEKIIEVI